MGNRDYYTEQLIKRQPSILDWMIRGALVALVAISILLLFFSPILLIVPALLILLAIYLIRRRDIEYEYLYVNGDLDIDKVIHKSRRKHLLSTSVDQLELLAPADHTALKEYHPQVKKNYASGDPNGKVYAMIIQDQQTIKRILFEPKKEIVDGFYAMAPRKVIRK